MKQNTYNKGRNKNFTPKSKKFKSQPLKEDFDKKETIEETLDQRLNNVIDKNKAISELIIGYIPYTIKSVSYTHLTLPTKLEV